MRYGMKQQRKPMRRRLALLMALALIMGMLPIRQTPVSKAAEQVSQTEKEAPAASAKPIEWPLAESISLEEPIISDGVTTWDCVYFGNYWQNDTDDDGTADNYDDKEPIKWRVLSADTRDVFLIADQILDWQSYNQSYSSVTWETCTLRTWLNETFLENAFSDEEQSAIKETEVVNGNNPTYGTSGGNNTQDKVYLLSVGEASNDEFGFASSGSTNAKNRRALNTEYAKEKGASSSTQYEGSGTWWLRSPGDESSHATDVNFKGSVDMDGSGVVSAGGVSGVRPVLHLDMTKASGSGVLSYAGTVTSDGTVATPAPTQTPTATPNGTVGNPRTSDGVTKWDSVYFGNYASGNTSEKKPIRWRVLSVNDTEVFLLAENTLASNSYYSSSSADIPWYESTLRTWLNDDFINGAFTSEERSAIRATSIQTQYKNWDSYDYRDTTVSDKIFLLSAEEVLNPAYGFGRSTEVSNKARAAVSAGWASETPWWLRSGKRVSEVPLVNADGTLGTEDYLISSKGVRPALHLNRSHLSKLQYAGEISVSDGRKAFQNPVSAGGVTTWDSIWFGNYWQEDTNGNGSVNSQDEKEPIRWRVLDVDGDEVLLMADKSLAVKPYDNSSSMANVAWKDSLIREWLNDDFLQEAFTDEEQSALMDSSVSDDEDETDQIYLLSSEEAQSTKYGFGTQSIGALEARKTSVTAFARGEYSSVNDWWLRDSGSGDRMAAMVAADGTVSEAGRYMNKGVRPVLRVDLSEVSNWVYANPVAVSVRWALQEPKTGDSGETTWNCIYFGNYWQNDTNEDGTADKEDEKEPIKWRVLSVRDKGALLIADKNLDVQPYHNAKEDVTWETSSLRQWMNHEFMNNAFTTSEAACIETSTVEAEDNEQFFSGGGEDTEDKLYLLSNGQANRLAYGFTELDSTRSALNTAFTAAGGIVGSEKMSDAGTSDLWWLRFPGKSGKYSANVGYNGVVCSEGSPVVNEDTAVRPVLFINLEGIAGCNFAEDANSRVVEEYETPAPTESPDPDATVGPTATPVIQTDFSNPRLNTDGTTTWDCLYYGKYWQSDTNGNGTADKNDKKEPIKWRVLSAEGNDLFLMADQNLDVQYYNDKESATTWERSGIRKWLNNEFVKNAFTALERNVIPVTEVVNEDNSLFDTEGGRDTEDQLYLLSVTEALNPDYGFSEDDGNSATREALNTSYAAAGGEIGKKEMSSTGSADQWWLRSPGYKGDYAAYVYEYGNVYMDGSSLYDKEEEAFVGKAVRPVMHLNLETAKGWTKAGTVNTENEEEPTPSAVPTAEPSASPSAAPGTEATETPGAQETEAPGTEATETPGAQETEAPGTEATETPGAQETEAPGMEATATPGAQETKKPDADPSTEPSKAPVVTPPASIGPNMPGQIGGNQGTTPSTGNTNTASSAKPETVQDSMPKAGKVVTISGFQYKILKSSGSQKTVTLLKISNKKSKRVKVPDTVKIQSLSYKVTEISKNAFKGCKKLQKVTLGKNISVIGSGAFRGCKKLKTVVLKSKILKKVGKNAFSGVVRNMKLRVPKGKLSKYRKMMKLK